MATLLAERTRLEVLLQTATDENNITVIAYSIMEINRKIRKLSK